MQELDNSHVYKALYNRPEKAEQFTLNNKDLVKMYIASVVEVCQPILNQRSGSNSGIQSTILSVYCDVMEAVHQCIRNNYFDITTYGHGYGIRLRLDDTCEWSLEIYPHIRSLTFPFQNMPEDLIKQIQYKLEVEDRAIT